MPCCFKTLMISLNVVKATEVAPEVNLDAHNSVRDMRGARGYDEVQMRMLKGLEDTEKLKWHWATYHSMHLLILVINNPSTCSK